MRWGGVSLLLLGHPGDILWASPDGSTESAEDAYRKAITDTHRSELRYAELQARNHLFELLATQGRQREERDALRHVYDSIEGGRDELEMVKARTLLGLDS